MPIADLYSEPPAPALVQGRTANAVTAPANKLYVTIPSFSPTDRWGPVAWTPHGTTMPPVGALCLLAKDDQGLWWVVAWVGTWT